MKTTIQTMIIVIGGSLLLTGPVNAQCVDEKSSLVSHYLDEPEAPRSSIWWDALGRELALTVDIPYTQVNDEAIKHIIFFATNHREKVMLDDAADRLLTIYTDHDDEGLRLMAVAALHAIGDKASMRRLTALVSNEDSRRVRHVAFAAVHDHNAAN